MQASISNNESIKISAAVSASRISNGTIYSCPANSYAILNVYITTNSDTISVGGQTVMTGIMNAAGCITIYVGPSQVVTTTHGSGTITSVSGVEFTNSP